MGKKLPLILVNPLIGDEFEVKLLSPQCLSNRRRSPMFSADVDFLED